LNRVLIVDDVEQNRELLKDFILALGYEPVLASNGKEALKKMEAGHIDLVLLDVSMPEMDGFEVLKNRRSQVALSPIPADMGFFPS